MDDLAQKHCTRIEASTPILDEQEIARFAEQLTGWQIGEKEGDPRLENVFKFQNFSQAMNFTTEVARISNEEDHHPAILTEWGKVTVTWWTHRIKGLHQNDFIMAAKTSKIYGDQYGSDK
jgi:4a-hydroxytetrahydrobiopterin dehydratase